MQHSLVYATLPATFTTEVTTPITEYNSCFLTFRRFEVHFLILYVVKNRTSRTDHTGIKCDLIKNR